MANTTDPRLAEIMTSLVKHLHGFAREVRLTEPEWE
ncbi:dioxygenase [Acinetobacter baumannii]